MEHLKLGKISALKDLKLARISKILHSYSNEHVEGLMWCV